MTTRPVASSNTSFDFVQSFIDLQNQVQQIGVTSDSGIITNDDGTVITVGDNSTYYQTNVIVGSATPSGLNASTDVSTIWYDTTTNPPTVKWWDGFGFQTYTPGQQYRGGVGLDALGPAVISRAQVSLRLYYQASAPGSPVVNWLWKNNGTNVLQRYNGSSWVTISDTNITTAVTNALTATATDLSDNYITVYYQATAPTGQSSTVDRGNLWFESDQGMKPWRWNGTAWVNYVDDVRLIPTGTDGAAPPYSPTPSVIPGFGQYFITWTEVPNADAVVYDVYASTSNPVVASGSTKLGSTESTFFVAGKDPSGVAFTDGTTWYFAIMARDPDGLAALSSTVSGGVVKQKIVRTQITDNAIDTPQLNANAVTAGIIASNSVYTSALQANSVDTTALTALAITSKHTMTGPVLQTASGGERIVVRNDGSGGIIESFSGLSGESAGYIDPAADAGIRPSIKIAPGTTGSYPYAPYINLIAGAAASSTQAIISSGGGAVITGNITGQGANNYFSGIINCSTLQPNSGNDMTIGGSNISNNRILGTLLVNFIGAKDTTSPGDGQVNFNDPIDMQSHGIAGVGGSGINVTAGGISVTGTSTFNSAVTISSGGIAITGASSCSATFTTNKVSVSNPGNGTSIPNCRYFNTSSGGEIVYTSHTNSSLRYKKNLTDIPLELAMKFLELRAFEYDLKRKVTDRPKGYRFVGFGAEQFKKLGLDSWIELEHGTHGRPDVVDYSRVVVPLQVIAKHLWSLVQSQQKQIDELLEWKRQTSK